jgi:ribose transport system permease protein
MNKFALQNFTLRHPYLFSLLLLLIAIVVNFTLQPNLFERSVLSGNLRVFLPLMLLAAGQAIVILGGGIDISVGAIVSVVNAVLVTRLALDSTSGQVLQVLALALGAGMLAGALNGVFTAYLRLQPIVTTYATAFIFGGVALFILPRPGGAMPTALTGYYRTAAPLGLPLPVYLILAALLLWGLLRATRFGRYLYAVGGQPEAAYATGVPVSLVRFSTYVISGLMAALAALVLTLNTGSGDPLIGGAMTLRSITAVVIGGTALSGGVGGVAGAIIGVGILGLITNIISFANVPSWWRVLVDASIIVLALAAPGIVNLLRRKRL